MENKDDLIIKTCRFCGFRGAINSFFNYTKNTKLVQQNGTCLNCRRTKTKEDNYKRKDARRQWEKNNAKRRYQKEKNDPLYAQKRRQDYEKNKAAYVTRAYNRYLRTKGQTLKNVRYKELQVFYKQAKQLTDQTGIKYNVDHIVPLKHESICGLNVPWNMQILPEAVNKTKSNKWDGTYNNNGWKNVERE